MDLDRLAEIRRRAIPEIGKLQLPRRIWERRVEDKANREEQIALADPVLAQQHDVAGKRNVDRPEIPEIPYTEFAEAHGVGPNYSWFPLVG
mgnify:CR=1 FL=1